MSLIYKILLAITLVAGISWAEIHFTRAAAQEEIQQAQMATAVALSKAQAAEQAKVEADKQTKVAVQKAAQWQGVAVQALDRVAALEKGLKAAQGKLAALAPPKPVTASTSIPAEQAPLAVAYTGVGFPATLLPDGALGFPIVEARPMLALIEDGQSYPAALERIGILNDETSILVEQKTGLQAAVDAKTQESAAQAQATQAAQQGDAACEQEVKALQGAVADQQAVVAATDKLVTVEKHKKFWWGAGGVAAGVIGHWLWVVLAL